jgi:hypothetical protein
LVAEEANGLLHEGREEELRGYLAFWRQTEYINAFR